MLASVIEQRKSFGNVIGTVFTFALAAVGNRRDHGPNTGGFISAKSVSGLRGILSRISKVVSLGRLVAIIVGDANKGTRHF
jgi:hypothetical protein